MANGKGSNLSWYRRPRSAIACQECARRKVRCDVEHSLLPCTNCKLDGTSCMLRTGKRGRRLRHQIESKGNSCHATASQKPGPKSDPCLFAQGLSAVEQSTPPSSLQGSSCLSSNEITRGKGVQETKDFTVAAHSPQDLHAGRALRQNTTGLPKHLDGADVAYLTAQKALEVPDQEFQRALLKSYLEYIHDFLPIIDIRHFLGKLVSGASRPEDTGLSLFVYQAIMFASVGVVPFRHLENAGFSSRIEARTLFASKVKALYIVGVERDPVCLIQALLIMAYWQDFVILPKGYAHWAKTAWSMMQGMLSDSVPGPWLDSDDQIPNRIYGHARIPERLFKKLYWFCFMIIRIVSLASRDPTVLLWAGEAQQTPLDLSDFDIAPFSEATLLGFDLHPELLSVEHQLKTAKLHMSCIQLCCRLGNAAYNPNALRFLDLSTALQLTERFDHQLTDLSKWYSGFPALVNGHLSLLDSEQRNLILRQSVPSIVFHAALASLLSQQAILRENALRDYAGGTQTGSLHHNRLIVTNTVAATFLCLQRHHLLQCLPPCIMALLLPATVTHLTRSVSPEDPLSTTISAHYLSQSLDAFCEMGKVTICAQRWKKIFEDMMERQRLSMSISGCASLWGSV